MTRAALRTGASSARAASRSQAYSSCSLIRCSVPTGSNSRSGSEFSASARITTPSVIAIDSGIRAGSTRRYSSAGDGFFTTTASTADSLDLASGFFVTTGEAAEGDLLGAGVASALAGLLPASAWRLRADWVRAEGASKRDLVGGGGGPGSLSASSTALLRESDESADVSVSDSLRDRSAAALLDGADRLASAGLRSAGVGFRCESAGGCRFASGRLFAGSLCLRMMWS